MNKIVIGSDLGAYSVTDATRNITITGLPYTLTTEQLAYVFNITQDELLHAPAEGLNLATVSGSVITYSSTLPALATGDILHIQVWTPMLAYDEGLDSNITTVLNPDSASWTSPEHLVDISAQVAATLRYVIPLEGFKDLSCHWKFSNSNAGDTVTMTLWATNNADADDTADTDWVDVTGDYFTKTLTVTNGTIEFAEVLENFFFLKGMVKLVVVSVGDTNAADIYIKKKSL